MWLCRSVAVWLCGQFEIVLELFWEPFWDNLKAFWAYFRVTLGSFWEDFGDPFGIISRSCWVNWELFWDPFDVLWDYFGILRGSL